LYSQVVRLAGACPEFAHDGESAARLLRSQAYACSIFDKNLRDSDGMDIAAEARRWSPLTEILIVTA